MSSQFRTVPLMVPRMPFVREERLGERGGGAESVVEPWVGGRGRGKRGCGVWWGE
jgi:hypothetical protein